jgi:chitodextrinase
MRGFRHFRSIDFKQRRQSQRLLVQSLLVFLAIMAAPALAVAATLYVDEGNSSCSSSGPGTQTTPFCTISAAASKAVAGDTVLVASGTYPEQVTVRNSGSSGSPITFKASGASVVVTGQRYGFYINTKSWIVVNGFTVTNTSSNGIRVVSSNNITLSNNHVTQSGQPVSGEIAQGIYLSNTSSSLVSGNLTDYNTDAGIYLINGTTGVSVIGNTSTNNARGYTRAAPGIDIRTSGNTVQGNICHDNEDSGIQSYPGASNNLIVNNLTYNNGDHGIDNNGATGQRIIGNTVYNNVTAGINLEGGSSGGTLANNISVDNGIGSPRTTGNIRVDAQSIPGTTLDYNMVFLTSSSTEVVWGTTKYSTLDAFVQATGMEAHGLEEDPFFSSPASGNFRLIEGSGAIDSANSGASGQLAFDLNNAPRVDDPATPNTGAGPRKYDDRGAFEYQPTSSTDTTPPSVPTNLTANAVSSSQINLSWSASTDNVGVAGYDIYRDGSLVKQTTTTSYSDTGLALSTTYTYTVAAYDAAGNVSGQSAPASATTLSGGGTTTMTFNPVGDATIQSGRPSSNYGTNTKLWEQLSPEYDFLMQFNVSGIGSGTVSSAILYLYNNHSGDKGGDFYSTGNNWSENTVTWNNAPVAANLVTSLGPVSSSTWVQVDLTSLITADGTYSLRVLPNPAATTNSVGYYSKEAAGFVPYLVVTMQ